MRFSIGFASSSAALNSAKHSCRNAWPSVERSSRSMLISLEILSAKRFIRILDRSAFAIFSLIFMYSWIEPRIPTPADRTAFMILTNFWSRNSFNEMAVSALMEETIRIGILKRDDKAW